MRSDKRGAIPADLPPILERLGLKSDKFIESVEKLERLFPRLVGPVAAMQERAEEMGRRWMHGVRPAAELFHDT